MPGPVKDDVRTRRRFLKTAAGWLVATPIAGLWLACASKAGDGGDADAFAGDVPILDPGAEATPETTPEAQAETTGPARTLSPERFAILAALLDALIPGDPTSAGALDAGAADYLDALLGAFAVDPPRIFAGGPYSGRHGGLDGFSRFVPLTRVEAIAWRMRLEGSAGVPEREFNGPYKGLRQRYEVGLDAADAIARAAGGQGFAELSRDDRRGHIIDMDSDFLQMAYEHAVEGTFGDPVYGGNRNRSGWDAIGYEGDRQPLGYTARQMSDPAGDDWQGTAGGGT